MYIFRFVVVLMILSLGFLPLESAFAKNYIKQCDNFKNIYHYNRVQVPNYPIDEYLNDSMTSVQKNDILHVINADKICILIAEQDYKLKNMQDGVAKTSAQLQLAQYQVQYTALLEAVRRGDEKTKRIDGFYDRFSDEFYYADFNVNKVLIDHRYAVQAEMGEIVTKLDAILKEKEAELVVEIKDKFESYDNMTESEKTAYKKDIQDSMRIILTKAQQDMEENLLAKKAELQRAVEKKYADQYNNYKSFAQLEIEDNDETLAAMKAFKQVLDEKQTMYKKRSDQIFDVSNIPFELLEAEIIKMLPLDSAYIPQGRIIASELPDSVRDIDRIYISNTKNITAEKKKADQIIMADLIALLTSSDFHLYKILKNPATEIKIRKALLNEEYSVIRDEISSLSDDIKQKISKEAFDQEKLISQEILENNALYEILKKTDLSDEDKKEIEAAILAIETGATGFIASDMFLLRMKNADWDEKMQGRLLKLVNGFGGYEDYIFYGASHLSSDERGTTIQKWVIEFKLIQNLMNQETDILPGNIKKLARFESLVNIMKEGKISTSVYQRLYVDYQKSYKKYTDARDEIHNMLFAVEEDPLPKIISSFIGLDVSKIHSALLTDSKTRLAMDIFARHKALGKKLTGSFSLAQKNVETTNLNGFSFDHYKNNKIIVKKQNDQIVEIYVLDENDRIVQAINQERLITFYIYDSLGRVEKKVLAWADAVYNVDTMIFSLPKNYRQKRTDIDKYIIVKYEIFEYSNEYLVRKKQYSPLMLHDDPVFKTEFKSIFDDFYNIQDFSGPKKSTLESMKAEYDSQKMNVTATQRNEVDDLLKNIVSSVVVTSRDGVETFDFIYNKGLTLDMIMKNDEIVFTQVQTGDRYTDITADRTDLYYGDDFLSSEDLFKTNVLSLRAGQVHKYDDYTDGGVRLLASLDMVGVITSVYNIDYLSAGFSCWLNLWFLCSNHITVDEIAYNAVIDSEKNIRAESFYENAKITPVKKDDLHVYDRVFHAEIGGNHYQNVMAPLSEGDNLLQRGNFGDSYFYHFEGATGDPLLFDFGSFRDKHSALFTDVIDSIVSSELESGLMRFNNDGVIHSYNGRNTQDPWRVLSDDEKRLLFKYHAFSLHWRKYEGKDGKEHIDMYVNNVYHFKNPEYIVDPEEAFRQFSRDYPGYNNLKEILHIKKRPESKAYKIVGFMKITY
ncbi:hypothetical protein COB57_05510 [Candidatus Peregrinibacteria bacterium]|nr:MAG: hypothetical protein COB57_05510 [Candidatus Peregrinibacteria bacterium]